jgi:RNA polymerase sigma factor (sigma-70 family)
MQAEAALTRTASCPDADGVLLQRMAGGDETALSALCLAYGRRVMAYAFRLTGDAETAEEVVQDVFLAAWSRPRSYRGDGRVIAWLLGITRNRALNAVRRKRPLRAHLDEAASLESLLPGPHVLAERRERQDRMRDALACLSRDHREAIELVFYQGLTLSEVAEVCRCPAGTVKSRLSHAKAHLRRLLGELRLEVERWTCAGEIEPLLPFYVAGTVDEDNRQRVESHLRGCGGCREAEALWLAAANAAVAEAKLVAAALPSTFADRVVGRAAERRAGAVDRAMLLVRAQVPLVRRSVWPASALVLGIGYLITVLTGAHAALGILAPIVAAAGVSTVSGPESDPAFEITLATPTPARQILLARLVLVFGYNLVLLLAASIGLLAIVPPSLLGTILLTWLAPMTFLSSLALTLSLVVGTSAAMGIAFSLWLVRWLAHGVTDGEGAAEVMHAYAAAWQQPLWLFTLAAVCLLAAWWMAGRNERRLAAI